MFYFYLASIIFTILSVCGLALYTYENKQLHEFLHNLELLFNNDNLAWQSQINFWMPAHRELEQKIQAYHKRTEKLRKDHIRALQEEKNLIASIAHDFQTPLTTMLGTIELLEKENLANVKLSTGQTLTDELNLIKERTISLSSQVKSFYLYSLIDSGDKAPSITEFSLFDLVANEIAARASEIEQRFANHVQIDLDEDLPQIKQDKLSCQRIVANLLKNCLEHGEEELKISLKSSFAKQILTFSNVWYNPGISDLSLICQRSYRIDSARSQVSTNPHAGLGMSIVHDLAESLNIKLTIYEKPYETTKVIAENEASQTNSKKLLITGHKARLYLTLTFTDYASTKRKDQL